MRNFIRSQLVAAAMLGLPPTEKGHAEERPPDPSEVRLVLQTGHTGKVMSVAFAPDGKRLLTGGDDGVRLWDVETGKELFALQGHASGVNVVAFAPDGRRVLTDSEDHGARLWDAQTGKELLTLMGHTKPVTAATFAPDGKLVLTGSSGVARLWDAQTGKELRQFKGHTKHFASALAVAPDGQRVLTGGDGVRLWDVETGKEVLALKGHAEVVHAATYSPDGRRVLTGSRDHTARLWDAQTGEGLLTLKGHTDVVNAVAFSPDGQRLLTGSHDQTARLWDAQSGKELLALRVPGGWVLSVAFSPGGKHVLTGSQSNSARLWDAQTGKELLALKGHTNHVNAAVFAPDGRRILTGSDDHAARLWDVQSGQQSFTLSGRTSSPVRSVAYSADGKRLLTSDHAGARLWDAQTGKQRFVFTGHGKAGVHAVAFAPDGRRVLTGSDDQTARLWDAQSGKELLTLKGHTNHVIAVAFAPDGKQVLTGSLDDTARLWDAETGKELLAIKGDAERVSAVAFSPDGKRILTGSKTARLWDVATGQELLTLKGHAKGVTAVAFSPDGKHILTGSGDRTARLWDAQTGKELLILKGHLNSVRSVAFSPDGKHALTGSLDKTTRLWDVQSGKELCLLVSFGDGTWAVVDPKGRFDASNGGDVEGLHWVVILEPIALKQLKERYYDPGLLAKYLGFNKEPPRDVAAFKDVKLYPEVAVARVDPKKPQLDVTLTNRGGGIGKVVVLVNGKELTSDARPRGATDADAAKLDLKLDLSNDPRLVPGEKNTVEVLAYNAEGYLSSRGLVREFDAPGAVAAEPPELYAVVAGVSRYRGEKLNLRYAAKDAEDFSVALRLATDRLFGADKVHLSLLNGATPETRPTRASLEKALEALKGTRPGDVVVVYLAGHGVTHGGQDGDWHYLTADAQSAELTDPAVRKAVTLSSAELTDLLKAAPAQKQVLILDTCHAGKALEKLTEKRDVPGSQVRALERVKDRTGMHVLAGCAADSVSYEASKYGQGLLTYSLLLGMRGAKLRDGEYVDIVDLFGFAADKVPELARDIGGVQRPTVASPRGASFDLGRLTAEDRGKVPLQQVKPVVLRAVVQLEKAALDPQGLSKRVNDRLREASSATRGANLVFVDADEFAGALLVGGRYKLEGDRVRVNVSLYEGEKERAAFLVEGSASKPDEVAAKIAAEVEKRLGR